MFPLGISLELRMTEVVVTTGDIRRATLHSNCHHQQTNAQLSYRPYGVCPSCRPTNSVKSHHKSHNTDLLTWRSTTLSLTTKGSWISWGGGCHASRQPSNASTPTNVRTYESVSKHYLPRPSSARGQFNNGDQFNGLLWPFW